MQMLTLVIAMLLLLQLKHFAADYLLQPGWMLKGKGSIDMAGGYAHAGLHAVGSLPALLLAGLTPLQLLALICAEFLVHYGIDYSKAHLSGRIRGGPEARIYWAMHGGDQLLHQLTYILLVYFALLLRG